ncbi:thiamine biosynthetic bifunctional enzyme [Sporothrix curviconia]|uniref:Thiamine biosynthetic bifunctional enzyme n=1 Tax=Sporothrix curviconia TaxID=1260050 RepID=A0ABP0B2E1_9PEZI
MPPPPVDYSVYLVTDPTPAILGAGRTVVEVVGAALAEPEKKHIGIVQLRDKNADARAMLATLAALHAYTAPAGAPLLVNDRVDVAVAAMARGHCEGVHLGQDDIDGATARKMLGPDAIIGVTASTVDEAVSACRDGADYLGLGTVFATTTKTNTKHVVGTAGIQRMLQALLEAGFGHIPAVCIGGIHTSNARRVVFQSGFRPATADTRDGTIADAAAPQGKELNGVAVVSAIMGAADPGAAAAALAEQVRLGKTRGPNDFYRAPSAAKAATEPVQVSPALVQRILQALHETTPLSHNMTNLVVQNIAANVALAVGASPIMSNSGAEALDLARLPGSALVINMGTVTPESLANYVKAIAAYNAAGRPVVFDPVGAGATDIRRAAVRTIMAAGYLDVIKGNEGEIQTVYLSGLNDEDRAREEAEAGAQRQQRGVDGSNTLDAAARRRLVRRLAAREKCVVVLTGAVDYVSDSRGERVAEVADGHPMLGEVTGTGCSLGTVISAAVSAAATLRKEDTNGEEIDTFTAVLAGMALYERAAARAAVLPSVHGPGTFVPAFLDELARCRRAAAANDMAWLA